VNILVCVKADSTWHARSPQYMGASIAMVAKTLQERANLALLDCFRTTIFFNKGAF
jgi:hypothetical protein